MVPYSHPCSLGDHDTTLWEPFHSSPICHLPTEQISNEARARNHECDRPGGWHARGAGSGDCDLECMTSPTLLQLPSADKDKWGYFLWLSRNPQNPALGRWGKTFEFINSGNQIHSSRIGENNWCGPKKPVFNLNFINGKILCVYLHAPFPWPWQT